MYSQKVQQRKQVVQKEKENGQGARVERSMEKEEYLPRNASRLPSIPQSLVYVHLVGLFFILILFHRFPLPL
jgi:hypothetical protein